MKMTKIFAGFAALAFVAGLGFVSCSNDDDEDDSREKINIEVDSADVAFSVIRSLCDLAQYDPEAVKEDNDDDYIGIETLPSGWQSMTFDCDQGVALDNDDSVRIIAANGVDDAKDFFFSMIGEEIDDETLSTSYTWSFQGLGSLTFNEISGDENLYATIDVDINRIPGVSQIRFVSTDYFEEATSESNAENSFSGFPYYSAGDVIMRNSDGTYWLCVRPAGGPLRKDKSYWICLSPYDKSGKSIIKSETKTLTTYWEDGQEEFTSKWKYAKNLMSLKTAKAAFHTLNAIVNPAAQTVCDSKNVLDDVLIYDALKQKGFDLLNFHRAYPRSSDGLSDEYKNKEGNFNIAYGSPKKDSKRIITAGSRENADVNYVQPFLQGLSGKLEDGKVMEYLYTKWSANLNGESKLFPYLISVTDNFDETFILKGLDNVLIYAQKEKYDFEDYLHRYTEENEMKFVNPDKIWIGGFEYHIVFSPELCIKDNKGAGTKPSNAYTDVYTTGMTNWWWNSLYSTVRYVDMQKVKWNDENK